MAAPQLPLLGDLMTSVPAVVSSEDAGGDILVLSFAQNFDDMLTAYSVSRETEMASLCRTFCTFLPNLVGVRVDVNGTPVDELLLVENQEGDLPGELYLRRESQVQLDNFCTLWFADEDGSLVKVERPVNYYDCSNPRQKLLELAKGPQPHDSIKGVAVMQENAITDTMMIGMALQDSTLLVNFSPAFVNVGNDMDAAKEQLLAYAIVNTLCENDMVSNVCIFRSGKQFEGFSGNIYWNGLFYPIPE